MFCVKQSRKNMVVYFHIIIKNLSTWIRLRSRRQQDFSNFQWRRKLEKFEGDGDEKFWVKGIPPKKRIGFGLFVHCLWEILLLFLIFLSFSWFFSPIVLPLRNFRGSPLTENFRGYTSPSNPSPGNGGAIRVRFLLGHPIAISAPQSKNAVCANIKHGRYFH